MIGENYFKLIFLKIKLYNDKLLIYIHILLNCFLAEKKTMKN